MGCQLTPECDGTPSHFDESVIKIDPVVETNDDIDTNVFINITSFVV